MSKSKLKSVCCKADITYSDPAPDFIGDKNLTIGTCSCICSKCGEPCNLMINERRTWTRNPKTQILKDKRKKIKDKITKKEINDY
jgi:hypothetical protein